jgi:hypothetical protein
VARLALGSAHDHLRNLIRRQLEFLDRLKRNLEPARPTPWMLPIEMPAAMRRRG